MSGRLPEHPSRLVGPEEVAAEAERLLTTVAGLSADDLAAPSECAGWSRGHVVSHLTYNATALAGVVRGAVDGPPVTMYASNEARDADIDSGAGRTPAEHLDALRAAGDELAAQIGRIRPEHADLTAERTPGSEILLSVPAVPFLRLNELVIHHVDLLAGPTFADVEPSVLEVLLSHHVHALAHRAAPVHLTVVVEGYEPVRIGDGGPQVTGSPAAVLAWLTRGHTDGVRADTGDDVSTLLPKD